MYLVSDGTPVYVKNESEYAYITLYRHSIASSLDVFWGTVVAARARARPCLARKASPKTEPCRRGTFMIHPHRVTLLARK